MNISSQNRPLPLESAFKYPSNDPYFATIPKEDKKKIFYFLSYLKVLAKNQMHYPFNWKTVKENDVKRFWVSVPTEEKVKKFTIPFRIHLVTINKRIVPLFTPKDKETLVTDIETVAVAGTFEKARKVRKAYANGIWYAIKRLRNPIKEAPHALCSVTINRLKEDPQGGPISQTKKLVEPLGDGSLFEFIDEKKSLSEPQITSICGQLLKILIKYPNHNDYKIDNIAYQQDADDNILVFPIDFESIDNFSHGTLSFLPPELVQKASSKEELKRKFDNPECTEKRNVWSMGLVLLSILTVNHPELNYPYYSCEACEDRLACEDQIPCKLVYQRASIDEARSFLAKIKEKIKNALESPTLKSLCDLTFEMLEVDYQKRIKAAPALEKYNSITSKLSIGFRSIHAPTIDTPITPTVSSPYAARYFGDPYSPCPLFPSPTLSTPQTPPIDKLFGQLNINNNL